MFEKTLVEGRTEKYYLIHLQRSDTEIQVYLYDDDDAGFSHGEDWHPYETWDYSSLEEMQRAMLSELRRRLLSQAPGDALPQQVPSLISILGRWLRLWSR